MTIIKLNNSELQALADTSAYTIIGAGGDLNAWVNGYHAMLTEAAIGLPKEWYTFTGDQMNEVFGLTGDNRYDPNLTFLAFPLDGLDCGKLALFRLRQDDKWFDDIVDNKNWHESEAFDEGDEE
jgi:hypothetical protein